MAGEDWSQGETCRGWPQLDCAGALWSVGYTSEVVSIEGKRARLSYPASVHQELRVSMGARRETYIHRHSEQSSSPLQNTICPRTDPKAGCL